MGTMNEREGRGTLEAYERGLIFRLNENNGRSALTGPERRERTKAQSCGDSAESPVEGREIRRANGEDREDEKKENPGLQSSSLRPGLERGG